MAKISEDGQGIIYSDFDILYAVDCKPYLEKKKAGNTELTYLSWSDAWAEVKKRYPGANYHVRFFDGKPWIEDAVLGYMVFVDMTINGLTHEMWLPVQDGANKAMKSTEYDYRVKNYKCDLETLNPDTGLDADGNPQYNWKHVDAADMSDINKSIMRCLVKGIAMHGLGLYIYSGEDVTEWTYEEHNAAATEFLKARRELGTLVDIRSAEFERYVCEKAGCSSIKPEVIVQIPGQMRRVTIIFKELIKRKKAEKKAEKQAEKEADEKKEDPGQ